MEELQIPTRRITAAVFTSDGQRLHGSLFLTDSPYHKGGPEDLIELLNDERTFIPFKCEEPEPSNLILSKAHIVRVHVECEEEPAFQDENNCTLSLADGSRLDGRIPLDTPLASSRLVDKLNLATRFMTLVTDGGLDFVQRAQIVRVGQG